MEININRIIKKVLDRYKKPVQPIPFLGKISTEEEYLRLLHNLPVPFHETLNVQDATKIQIYMSCPRLYLLEYILGLRQTDPIHNLVFGKSYHIAKDILFTDGYSLATVDKAFLAFLDDYRKTYGEETDLDFRGKNPANVELALLRYIDQYKNDKFKVVATEIGVTVPIEDHKVIHGKMDSIIYDEMRGFYSLETKTSGAAWGYLEDSYQQKFQIWTYMHFLNAYYSMTKEPIYGIVIDVTIFTKEPDHVRIHVENDPKYLMGWWYEARRLLSQLEHDFVELSKCKKSDPLLNAFPRCTESCVRYNRICSMFDICHSTYNPLTLLDGIPAGYKVEYWDPRKEEVKEKWEVQR